ncbi:hypothetical protein DFH09DRAFT_1097492 [Mycena vulgaris]|nr:hypothetical protein DFH09DRAFT_1097492 [Mycena vulgaris]
MLKIDCAPSLEALICHRPGSAGELQNGRGQEAQRAVDGKNVANIEGYKQVQSDTRHLLNIQGSQAFIRFLSGLHQIMSSWDPWQGYKRGPPSIDKPQSPFPFPSQSPLFIMFSWSKILGLASVAAATALLGMVAFDVPYFKSVYFLRLNLGNGTATATTGNGTSPFVDLGALGFCTDLQDGRGLQ